ncbi:hypothetical protein F5B22DRAFT_651150 [Xylaria bambusicola]|uniref:uncharacterized protein n=1 Tax=Xylaria bambusicola TaxID=326684 RepID=UPI0020086568|nr:uncharacterized protein F5B22DRAFT_651150 [Xylaria bambusicola]KAI0505986.1 hypothetical protein F5B22DRAFT_651150 [Xylaria bambusicola]
MSSSGHDDEPSPEERPAKNPVAVAGTQRVKKKRVRNFTEDDRAAHRIFEKSRREAFKEALTVSLNVITRAFCLPANKSRKNLASLLPALADTEPQRLSKHVVVDESIAFIKAQHEQIRTFNEHLESVKTERDELLAELNHWRGRAVMVEPQPVHNIAQPTMHHGDNSTASDAIMGTVPTALQSTDSPMHIIGEPAAFPNPIHDPNLSPSVSVEPNANMHWESFEPQIHPFIGHTQNATGSVSMAKSDSDRMNAQSPLVPQFNVDQGQHGAVFLPFEPPQPFNATGFQTDTFMSNAVPLQDYMPIKQEMG